MVGHAYEQLREGSRVVVLWGSRAGACGVTAHLRQAVLGYHRAQELGGAVQSARPGRSLLGKATGGSRHPVARLVTVAGCQAAGGGCRGKGRNVPELVVVEVVEPVLQGVIAAVPYV
jgi:hypothetical protein